MSPVNACPEFGVSQCQPIEIKLRLHHVEVTGLDHWPVYESLVLCGETAATPHTEIRTAVFVVGLEIAGIIGKQTAIELCRPLSVCITCQLIAEEVVVTADDPPIGARTFAVNHDITAIPELLPPGTVLFPKVC